MLCVSDRKSAEVKRSIQKLELTDRKVVPLRAGSEINLASSTKQNKRTSFRQSLAIYSERAQVGKLNLDMCGWGRVHERPVRGR